MIRLFKILFAFLLVYLIQFPALAACPIPELNVVPRTIPECTPNPQSDTGCDPVTVSLYGSWKACLQQGQYRVYRVYYVDAHYYDYGYTSFTNYYVYYISFHDGQGIDDYGSDDEPITTENMAYYGVYYVNPPPQMDSFINPEMQCWCPPPPCLFPECVIEEISKKFPFDIFLGIDSVPLNCPGVTFFDFYYQLCFIYEALRFLKYPIAVALLVKLVMAL